MNVFVAEQQLVNNQAICAAVIWRAVVGGAERGGEGKGLHLLNGFLCLPILLNATSRQCLQSSQRQLGLRGFISKFEVPRKARANRGDLLGVHERALQYRRRSLEAISLACSIGLISLQPESGTMLPVLKKGPTGQLPQTRELLRNAEKLGYWMAEHSVPDVFSFLKVRM